MQSEQPTFSPYSFVATASVPSPEELKQLQLDNGVNYLFVKEEGQPWQIFYSTFKNGARTLEKRDLTEMSELNALLADVNDVSAISLNNKEQSALKDNIKVAIKSHGNTMSIFKQIAEIISSEDSMMISIDKLLKTANSWHENPKFSKAQLQELDAFMERYKQLKNAFADINTKPDLSSATSLDEKIVLQMSALADAFYVTNDRGELVITPKYAANREAFQEITLINGQFQIFLENLVKQKVIDTTIKQATDSQAFTAVQRMMRYPMLSDPVNKYITSPKIKLSEEFVKIREETFKKMEEVSNDALAINNLKKQSDDLGSHVNTQGLLGILSRELLSQNATVDALGDPHQNKVMEELLNAVNTISNGVIKDDLMFTSTQALAASAAMRHSGGHDTVRDPQAEPILADKFYEVIMKAYIDSTLFHSQGAEDVLKSMRELVKTVDKHLIDRGFNGIIFKNTVDTSNTNKDRKVLQTLSDPGVNPQVRENLVEGLFVKIKDMLDKTTTPNLNDERAYNNAIATVQMMGKEAVDLWNRKAAQRFYDLTIPKTVKYNDVIKLEKTETARNAAVVEIIRNAQSLLMGKIPKDVVLQINQSIEKLDRNVNSQELRQNLLATLVTAYQHAYLVDRTKTNSRAGVTHKGEHLKQIEVFLKHIETQLNERGQDNLFIQKLDARGEANMEDVVFPSATLLRPEQLKTMLTESYNSAKNSLTVSQEKYGYINAFKEIQKIGPAAKAMWQTINAADPDPVAGNLKLTEKQMTAKIDEASVEVDFKAKSKFVAGQEPLSPASSDSEPTSPKASDSPRSSSPANDSPRDSIIEPLTQISRTSEVNEEAEAVVDVASAPTADTETARRRFAKTASTDVLGVIADELISGREKAVKYGFIQIKAWDTFTAEIVQLSSDMVKADKGFSPETVYETMMRVFVDSYLQHEEGKHDLFSDVIRSFVVNVDRYLLNHYMNGVVYNNLESLDIKKGKDAPVLQTLETATPEFRSEIVNKLFDNLQAKIEKKGTHDPQEAHLYQRTLEAIQLMGPQVIAEWNARADQKFFELKIPVINTYAELTKLGENEMIRRNNSAIIVKNSMAELTAENFKLPEKDRLPAEILKATADAINAAVKDTASTTRSEFNERLKVAILNLYAEGYKTGRLKNWGMSDKSDNLKLIEKFIKNTETRFNEQNQKGLLVDKVGDLEPVNIKGTYVMAGVVFESAKELSNANFEKFVQQLYDSAKKNSGDQKLFVNIYKAIERIDPQEHRAKIMFNQIAANDKANPEAAEKLKFPNPRIEWPESLIKDLHKANFENDKAAKLKMDKLKTATTAKNGMFKHRPSVTPGIAASNDQQQPTPKPSK